MAIIVNGKIEQRADETASWDYVNPVLPDKQLGWEYDDSDDRNPVGVKMGDGETAWDELPYWFTASSNAITINVPAGSAYPLILDVTGTYPLLKNGFIPVCEISTGSTSGDIINDIRIEKIYTNSGKTEISSVKIYGHTSDFSVTVDDLKVTFYI